MLIRGPGLILALCALGLCVFAGCGRQDDETTTVTTTVSTGDGTTTEQEQHRGPRGTVGIRIFGPVTIGMTEHVVRSKFGRPDKVTDVNFSGTSEAPQTNWVWDVAGGSVTLKFDNSNGTLAGYSTDSPQFESAAGVSVGDSIRPVQTEYGDALVPSPLGTGALVLSEGTPGSSPALTFALEEGGTRIVEISGGAVVQPAGE